MTKQIIIKDRIQWCIRKYYKSGHGALIVGESDDGYYGFLNITKHPPSGYSYLETEKPINNKDTKSFVRLYMQKDKKKFFSKWLMKYELDEKDLERIEEFLRKIKKR